MSPSPSLGLDRGLLVEDLAQVGAWFGIFCDTYRSGDVPSADAIRDSMGALEPVAANLERVLSLEAPQGWLAIVNDSKAVGDKVSAAALAAAFAGQSLEERSPEVADALLVDVRAACESVSGEVQAIAEAVDAMP
ncbi:MAG: hypothetical protein C0498_10755 [Anaerolinea sp.]|jgi:hypothetical protein|nr:hypothetical protein [Anaerolinea sp.]